MLRTKRKRCSQAQRTRGRLIREVRDSFKVDAFVGNATDWEKVCVGNLVGMPVIVLPTGFKKISNAPSNNTRRRTTLSTGIYAPPEHDHIVRLSSLFFEQIIITRSDGISNPLTVVLFSFLENAGVGIGYGLSIFHRSSQAAPTDR